MLFRLISFWFIFLTSLSLALVETEQEEAEGRGKWRVQLESAAKLPVEERIPILQSALLKLSQPSIYPNRELAQPLFEKAKDLMLSTPGYADYYRDKLIEMNKTATKDGPSWSRFCDESGYIMETLKLLPTPETVRALSELLDCEQTRNVPLEGGSLAHKASAALSYLVENPPARSYPEPWKEWRDRVNANKETFQLKGLEVRYSFNGPVTQGRLEPKSGNSSLDASASTAKTEGKNFLVWPLAIAGVLLAVAVWFALKRKPAAS